MNERKERGVIRPSGLTKDDQLAVATLLIKAGYAVRITTQPISGKTTKEKIIEYWKEV
jgi:hypothetical protein